MTSVQAVVTVKVTIGERLDRVLHYIIDPFVESIPLELVSAELDPETGLEKETIRGYAHRHRMSQDENEVKYEWNFEVAEEFGEIGAVLVENEHTKELYLKNIAFHGFPDGPVCVTCNSWVASKFDNPEKRIFFTNKPCLPGQTPSGLMRLRKKELENLQGDGQGERKTCDRIYDYDVYNDIGDPDKNSELKRPVLGGKEHPYPRRCRTGRPRCNTDPLSESRESGSATPYVPRDELFSVVKKLTFFTKTAYSALHAAVPSLEIADQDTEFPHFTAIDSLFNEGVNLQSLCKKGVLKYLPSWLVKFISYFQDILRFETPALVEKDKFSWLRDEEFSRQTLAGLNPCSIQLVKEWPLSNTYGAPESAITTDLIEREIKGIITLAEALQEKKLFMLDYHDLLLPYVKKVRDIGGTTLYGSRTLFFLAPDGMLRPLAIELTRPPMHGKAEWKQVFTPTRDATGCWLWRLAKTHVLAHDSGYHQLVSHWLRTHCATEPYIIASNRQLSAMHPIYRLLHPHFRYTMEINALARKYLINAGGIIEKSFSLAKYCMELSSVAYDQQWRFDLHYKKLVL